MNALMRGMVSLVKSALTSEAVEMPDDMDWDKVYGFAAAHQVVPLIYYGIRYCGINLPEETLKRYKQAVYSEMRISELQERAVKEITAAFDAEGIEYMPLKGLILKSLYPNPVMRGMSDVDILIKTSQYEKISDIVAALGFSADADTDHEFVWSSGAVKLELHKRLMPSYNKDYYAYYGDNWRLAHLADGSRTRYALCENDELIYLFIHFSKHYRGGGIGIRHLADLYIYIKSVSVFDDEYIREELTKLQLYDFYRNIRRTIDAWFDGGEADDITDFITKRIFESGAYGTKNDRIFANALRESKEHNFTAAVRINNFLMAIFFPYKDMARKYPVLVRFPILLPFYWCVRLFSAIFRRSENIKNHSRDLKLMSGKYIKSYQSELNYVGLDFNFNK